jgi:predicted nucleic acid-binding protein
LEHSSHFESCKNFIERIEKGEMMGFVNSIVISETYFTYMRIQIKETFDITLEDVIEFIKKDPDAVKTIDLEPVDMVFKIPNIYLTNIQRETLESFGNLVLKYGLLPNDTLHAVTCYDNKIEDIATNDSDFERVDFLKIWKP